MSNQPRPVAYSYVRFSSPEQEKGDSLRRQTEAAADWCKKNRVRLDTSTTLHDLGKSAFLGEHRKNPDRHALAAFLKLVEQGRVPRGSYLVIENLDRLSREHIQPALLLALNLLQAGIRIVQLKPEMVFDDKSDTLPVMMMMVELSRGHSESARKSERIGAAWAEKKKRARQRTEQEATARMGDGCHVVTRRLPGWVEERGGKPCPIPEREAVVRRIYHLAAAGYGHTSIAKKLTEEGAPTFGRSGKWRRSYIAALLRDRRVLGEYQPKRDHKPDGDPIPGYFPEVIKPEEWDAARAGAAQRRRRAGRIGNNVNLFTGLLRNARDGDKFFYGYRPERRAVPRYLFNEAGKDGRTRYECFPANIFERAVLDLLREINPQEILNGDSGPDETLILSGQLTQVQNSIDLISAEMDAHGESPTLFRRLREKEDQYRDLAAKLAAAQEKAAHPLSEAWGQCQTLAAAVDSAPDPIDARLRLRSALRRIIESVWLLIVPCGKDRLCAVQVWFAGGKRHRDYLILYQPTRNQFAPGDWWARSLAAVASCGDLDLRRRKDAGELAKTLAGLDPEKIRE
jgi:DNA invertase Pin-like site-specific DNA recombinase